MCGRFAVTTDPARLAVQLDALNETGVETGGGFAPNYNVAPTAEIAAVVLDHDERRLRPMRWGLLPHWVKADADGRPLAKTQLINARAETLTTSPAYRAAAAHTRCLVPMDGYYEWKPNPDNPRRGRKTPYFFYRPDGRPLLVAGLWSVWRPDRTADPILTCTVITTQPPAEFAAIHDRMPLVLEPDDWDRWLDPDRPAPVDLLACGPAVGGMAMREVSTLVNAVANNGPELIEPAGSVTSIEPAGSVGLF